MEGMAGGGMRGMQEMIAGAIIPAADIVEATKTALENAAKAPAEEPKTDEAKTEETKPETETKKPE
jgi:hypothetical protein